MTENPADIRREIEIAMTAANRAVDTLARCGLPDESAHTDRIALAICNAHGAHLYDLFVRLARAEADPTNNAQREP